VEPGKHLADQGEFAYEFFVIEEGSAVVTKDDEHLKDLVAGDFFGEIALMETDRRTATVTASSPTRLIVMHGRDFREMASEMPHVAEKIRTAIRERTQR
jgi:CRP-like cAMP-binding protein